MLTIFSSPRPFRGEFDYIQRNAIQSWLSACPGCEVILVGDEEGTEKVASELKIKYIPEVEKNEKGVILRNSIFSQAQKAAQNELVGFVSADIILTSDFLEAVRSLRLSTFLLSGRRWDLDIKEKINFDDVDWEKRLRSRLKKEGRLHGLSANDYFVFPRSLELNIPSFSVKHGGWDNWLIYKFKSFGIPVIDATEVVTVVHQNHDRSHLKKNKSVWKEEDGKREIRSAGGFSNMCTMREADLVLTRDGLKKPPLLRQILSKLALFYPWQLLLSLKRRLLS